MKNLDALLAKLFTRIEDINEFPNHTKNALIGHSYKTKASKTTEKTEFVGDLVIFGLNLCKIDSIDDESFNKIADYINNLKSLIPNDIQIDWFEIKALYKFMFYDFSPTETTFKEFTEALALKKINNVETLTVCDEIKGDLQGYILARLSKVFNESFSKYVKG